MTAFLLPEVVNHPPKYIYATRQNGRRRDITTTNRRVAPRPRVPRASQLDVMNIPFEWTGTDFAERQRFCECTDGQIALAERKGARQVISRIDRHNAGTAVAGSD